MQYNRTEIVNWSFASSRSPLYMKSCALAQVDFEPIAFLPHRNGFDEMAWLTSLTDNRYLKYEFCSSQRNLRSFEVLQLKRTKPWPALLPLKHPQQQETYQSTQMSKVYIQYKSFSYLKQILNIETKLGNGNSWWIIIWYI